MRYALCFLFLIPLLSGCQLIVVPLYLPVMALGAVGGATNLTMKATLGSDFPQQATRDHENWESRDLLIGPAALGGSLAAPVVCAADWEKILVDRSFGESPKYGVEYAADAMTATVLTPLTVAVGATHGTLRMAGISFGGLIDIFTGGAFRISDRIWPDYRYCF